MNDSASEANLSPGEMLRQQREAQERTENEIANHLNISVTQVRYLENNEFDKLNAPVFVRGYIKTYTRFLGLDTEACLSCF